MATKFKFDLLDFYSITNYYHDTSKENVIEYNSHNITGVSEIMIR